MTKNSEIIIDIKAKIIYRDFNCLKWMKFISIKILRNAFVLLHKYLYGK